MNLAPLKQPAAYIPLAMSAAALMTVLSHVAIFGVAREVDEGVAAHLWQLLMAGQLPVVTFYALKWIPLAPKRTLQVLGVQVGAALAAVAPVWWLGL